MNKHSETIIFDRNKVLTQANLWTDAMKARELKKENNQVAQQTFSNDPEDYKKVHEIKGIVAV